MSDKTTGRPRNYGSDQVRTAIDIVEASDAAVTAASVKAAMVAELGVSGGINALSLERELDRLLDEREAARMARLIAALPQISRNVADEIARMVRTASLGHLAVELDRLRSDADRRVAAREDDLAAQRDRNAALARQIDERDVGIAILEARVETLARDLATARAGGKTQAREIERLQQREDIAGQLAAMLRDVGLSMAAGIAADAKGLAFDANFETGAEAPDPKRFRSGEAGPTDPDAVTSIDGTGPGTGTGTGKAN